MDPYVVGAGIGLGAVVIGALLSAGAMWFSNYWTKKK